MKKGCWPVWLTAFLLLGGAAAWAREQPENNPPRAKQRRAQRNHALFSASSAPTGGNATSSNIKPPTPADNRFLTDAAPALDTPCWYRSQGPLIFNIEIKRVVAPTNGLDGTLADPAAAIDNGLVSKTATLELVAWDVDSDGDPNRDPKLPPIQPEFDLVSVNGHAVGYLYGFNNQWKKTRFEVPIAYLKFGTRSTSSPPGEPTPGINVIQVDVDTGNFENDWCTALDWGAISFDAMAPIIMVHGNQSNGQFFEAFNFIAPFAGFPFDNSISMPTDTVAQHADWLASSSPTSTPILGIPYLASTFGAKHAHIIAHSKGGLDSRDFMARLPPDFGVLSLTTLCTPHKGSVGADYQVLMSRGANAMDSDNWAFALATQLGGVNKGTNDLTLAAARDFNDSNRLPFTTQVDDEPAKTIAYFAVSADADENANGKIDPAETLALLHRNSAPDSEARSIA